MGKRIVITSGKGGVGKTTVVANLGTALSLLNQKVVMIDGDIGLRNLDLVLGMENRIVYDLVDVVEERCKLRQALIRDRRLANLYLLPATQTRDKEAVHPKEVERIALELVKEFDYVLLDSPAGIDRGFANTVAGAEDAIIVTTPEVASIRDADRVAGLLESRGFPSPKVVINKIRPQMVREGNMLSVDDVLEILGLPLLGIVPDDSKVVIATNRGESVLQQNQTPTATCFNHMARRLRGENLPIEMHFLKEPFWKRLTRLFRRS